MEEFTPKLNEISGQLILIQNRQIKLVEALDATSRLLDKSVKLFNELIAIYNERP